MKIFKNFKTKRQLREENERLKAMLMIPQPVRVVERKVEAVRFSFAVPMEHSHLPEEIIKGEIARKMADCIKPLIEYDFSDGENGGKIYTGKLYIARRMEK